VIAELSESDEKKSKPKPPRLPDSEGKRQAVGWLTIIVVLGLIVASWLPNNSPEPVGAPRLADENILFEDSLAKTSAAWAHDDMELTTELKVLKYILCKRIAWEEAMVNRLPWCCL
jgi:hypothetical protein